jgi:hypothetical protein
MRDGWLGPEDIWAIVRQGVDLLDPSADVRFYPSKTETSAMPGAPGWVYEQLHFGRLNPMRDSSVRIWEVQIDTGTSHAKLRLDSAWQPAEALGNVIADLHGLCQGRYHGHWFPACPGHEHAGEISLGDAVVLIQCPSTHRTVTSLKPAAP